MALRFMDGFNHYTTATDKWTSASNATLEAATGRTSQSMRLGVSNAAGSCTKVLDNQGTWIIGAAVKFGSLTAADSVQFYELIDTATAQIGLNFSVDGSGKLKLYRGSLTTLLATGTLTLSANQWYYIEMKAVIANSGGSVTVKVDGVTDISYSGDTSSTANDYANTLKLTGFRSQSGYIRFDDLYLLDGTGSAPNNDFLGNVKVETLVPNGNGNSSVFVGSDANSTDNYLLVDEATPNDADYVDGATVGDKDTDAYSNLATTTGTVYGIQICNRAQKTDAGARSIASVARHSATEVDCANQALSTTFALFTDIRETKPGGGTWAISDVNGAEFGVKVTV